jgi:hypothetical protein
MNKTSRAVYFNAIVLLCILSFSACVKKDNYSPIPSIKYVDFIQGGDTAAVIFSFTDGDGNIGLGQADTSAPMAPNCFLTYYEKENGIWKVVDWPAPNTYRLPFINTSSKDKPISGEIRLKMNYYYLNTPFDTIKFDIYIIDRTLNKSNIITTRDIIKP